MRFIFLTCALFFNSFIPKYSEIKLVILRLATIEDANDLLEWRNDPLTRKNSTNQNIIKLESHLNWLENTLKCPTDHLFIAESLQRNAVGTARAYWDGKYFELSWTVSPRFRKQGIGKKIVSVLANQFFPAIAKIKTHNISSKKIAENIGFSFSFIKEKDNFAYYKIDYPKKYSLGHKKKLKIVDEIEQTRTKNNVNWMNILRLAYTNAPEEAQILLEKINLSDNKISHLIEQLSESNNQ